MGAVVEKKAINLRIPGPTPVPPHVLEAMSRPMINHRGPQFAQMIAELTEKLKEFFQTKNDVVILTAAGTGAMEAAVVNTLSPGDKVLAVSIGAFGDRFAEIAEVFGADVVRLDFPPGQAADPEAIGEKLATTSGIKALLVTHNETSTGVTNDLAAISRVARQFNVLILADAISSIGAIDLPVDEWGIDVMVTASQKGWMVPPGLAMASVSPKAWEAHRVAKMPRYYWDFSKAMSYLARGQTPWTPAVSVFFAFMEALKSMNKEGLANIIARHKRVGQYTRAGIRALGLELFADEKHASDTVTAVKVPPGVASKELLKRMREEHGVVLSGGQLQLANVIFRIGHLGHVTEADIDGVLNALKVVLPQMGFQG